MVLARQKAKQANILPMNNKNVFTAVYGGLVHSHAINRAIASALSRLADKGIHIDHFTAHALRDTFATRFIEQGGQPQTLKTILGHSSLAMTMDLYAHVLPNTKQEEMNNIHIAL
jgi:integrase